MLLPTPMLRSWLTVVAALLFLWHAQAQEGPNSTAPIKRLKVTPDAAAALLVQKVPIQYPDAARAAGIQGTVVLSVVISSEGSVKDVIVKSGDPVLAQPVVEAVKNFKYKPYIVEGKPVEIETEISLGFHLKSGQHPAPPLGVFKDGVYSNEYFGVNYPLSREWVRETDLLRKKLSADAQSRGMYVLLAALHTPEHIASTEADSSFVLSATGSLPGTVTESCDGYIAGTSADFQAQGGTVQKGVTTFNTSGHDFRRADFQFREVPKRRAIVCTRVKDYLLLWNISGSSASTVDSTISSQQEFLSPSPKPNLSSLPAAFPSTHKLLQAPVRVSGVDPIYPPQARRDGVSGSVKLRMVISKTGNVEDVEVMDGPTELVVSAVNAVRLWKFKPGILDGEAVDVNLEMAVNFVLRR